MYVYTLPYPAAHEHAIQSLLLPSFPLLNRNVRERTSAVAERAWVRSTIPFQSSITSQHSNLYGNLPLAFVSFSYYYRSTSSSSYSTIQLAAWSGSYFIHPPTVFGSAFRDFASCWAAIFFEFVYSFAPTFFFCWTKYVCNSLPYIHISNFLCYGFLTCKHKRIHTQIEEKKKKKKVSNVCSSAYCSLAQSPAKGRK